MKKRLRKKLRKGKFQELGFGVRFRLDPDLDESAIDTFVDQFLEGAIEAAGLGFGGGGHHACDGFVTVERGSATEQHRAHVDRWLREHPLVVEHKMDPLQDARYGE